MVRKKIFSIDEVVVCLNLDNTRKFSDDAGVKVQKDVNGIYYQLLEGEKTYINKLDLSDDTEIYRETF